MSSGIFTPPHSVQRAGARLRPRLARAGQPQGRARPSMAGQQIEIPMIIGGQEVRTGKHRQVRHAARPSTTCWPSTTRAAASEVEQAIAAAPRRAQEWSRTPVGGPRRRVPARRRPAGRPVARHPQRRHHAGAVEDRLPGRDRRRLRAGRLLALQPDLHAADHGASSRARRRASGTGSSTGRWRASCSRSRRSTSRRSPATCRRRSGPDGQHRDPEAGLDRRLLDVLPDEAARAGRPAAGRHQHGARLGRRDRRRRAALARPGRHPLHRLDGGVPVDVATVGDNIDRLPRLPAASSARPAARTSSSPTPRPTPRRSPPRSCAARSSTRARSARPPRASTRRPTCGRRSGRHWRPRCRPSAWAIERLPQLHGRGHRRRAHTRPRRTRRHGREVGRRRDRGRWGHRRQRRLLRRPDRGRNQRSLAST